ncbi:hypothetical protein HYC85_011619 [Camellia sinensis]|uniref:Amino acid transporter transmembrane domain-containing protein n=1 Tax=Camellia sinensis TaxID=4442 RepID=A0A7J7HCU8_CAMSI|nr:hypothetical protein HYC85_011619 [Camellia sinensis]
MLLLVKRRWRSLSKELWTAIAHVITGVIGAGVLSLAWSTAQLGWVGGPLTMLVFAAITIVSADLLCDCYRSPDPEYGSTRSKSYVEAVKLYLGENSKRISGLFLQECMYGCGVAYVITSAASVRAIQKSNCYHKEGHEASCDYGDTVYMVLFGVVQIVASQIPDFHNMAWLSFVAAIMSFFYASIGFVLGFATKIRRSWGALEESQQALQLKKLWLVFQALGDVAFAYPYTIILLEIQDTLKSPPPENWTMKKASMSAIFITTFFYLCCGCFGYAAFGDKTPGNLLSGFGFYEPFWLIDFANACIILHLVGGYQVYSQPVFAIAERWFGKKYPNSRFVNNFYNFKLPLLSGFQLNPLRLCFRTFYVISTTVIAVIFPYFNQVLGVLGALNFWPLAIYFPVEMYLVQKKIGAWTTKWIVLQTFSIVCLIVSILALIGSPHLELGPTRNHSYLEAVHFNLGERSSWACGLCVNINLYGIGIAYTITSAISMRAIQKSNCYHKEGHKASCEYGDTVYMVLFGVVQIVASQIPDFHNMAWLSFVAAIMSFFYSSIGFVLGFATKIMGSIGGVPTGITTEILWLVFQALGDVAFAYPYTIILLEIQKASRSTIFITTFFYLSCGCFEYAAFGDKTPGNLLSGFGFYEPFWLIDFANACIILHLVRGYQVYSQPMFAIAERWFGKKYPNSGFVNNFYNFKLPLLPGFQLNLLRLCFRTFYVISTTVIAVIFPYFNQVLGVLGALNFWPLAIYFPVEMYFVQKKIRAWTTKWIVLQTFSIEMESLKVTLQESQLLLHLRNYGWFLRHFGTLLLPIHTPSFSLKYRKCMDCSGPHNNRSDRLGWIGGSFSMLFFAFITLISAFLLSNCYGSPHPELGPTRNHSYLEAVYFNLGALYIFMFFQIFYLLKSSMSQPLFALVDKWFARKFPNSGFVNNGYTLKLPFFPILRLNLLRLCFRTTYVASTTVIAMIFPYFNQVLGVLGALNFWPISIYFPVEIIVCLLVTMFTLVGFIVVEFVNLN